MSYKSLGRGWCVLVAVLSCSLTGRAEEPESPPATSQVRPLTEDPDVPIVRLTPEGPDVPWDAFQVGEFSLLDQNGEPVTNESLRGKPWVANFIFTRCTVECPLLLRKTYDLHRRTEKADYRIVTITVDPKYDTVEVMKRQSDVFGVDPDRWIFMTGPEDKVYDLIRKGFKQAAWENVGTDKKPGMEFAHSLNMIHVDADGKIVGKYDGRKDADMETLAQVLEGKTETPKKHRPFEITTEPPLEKDGGGLGLNGKVLPGWVARLPGTNAMLNGLATLLLLGGYSAIRARDVRLHRKLMLFAFATSVVFLASYLTYHAALRHYTGEAGKPFQGQGWIRPVYFSILISHILLAGPVAAGALATITLAYRQRWVWHRRIAKIVYPLWLYVSITGVVIYGMLYHLPAGVGG